MDWFDLQQISLDKDNLAPLWAFLTEWGLTLGRAMLVFLIGRWIAGFVLRVGAGVLKRSGTDEMLIHFVRSIANAFLLLIVTIVTLSTLGIDTTSLIAVLGAAGLAIGLALQSSLQNFASGVLLLVFRPFKHGDYVEAGGTSGKVRSISLFSTELLTLDNKAVIVPNGGIWSNVIINYTTEATRRIDMVFGVGYGDDLSAARDIIERIIAEDDRILTTPSPQVAVAELADSSVNFIVRPWAAVDDYWEVKFSITEKIKLAFDAAGISIPYPQMDVHLEQVA